MEDYPCFWEKNKNVQCNLEEYAYFRTQRIKVSKFDYINKKTLVIKKGSHKNTTGFTSFNCFTVFSWVKWHVI